MNAGKSNDKRILVPTDISVGVKVVKSNSSNGTIQRKTTGHCSREKLNGRFWHILTGFLHVSASCSLLKLTRVL